MLLPRTSDCLSFTACNCGYTHLIVIAHVHSYCFFHKAPGAATIWGAASILKKYSSYTYTVMISNVCMHSVRLV